MKDDKKAEMKRHYTDILELQKRLRSIAQQLHLQLEPDPDEPGNVDELALAMSTVRVNMNIVERGLNDADWRMNGPELRTRPAIEADIDHDTYLLAKPGQHDTSRRRDEIEINIAYDQMQLRRI